jgi:hypothetical protein
MKLREPQDSSRPWDGMVMNVAPLFAGITDEELLIYAMREAQLTLAQHIERSPADAEETISVLLEILDRPDVMAATRRLCVGYGLRPIT